MGHDETHKRILSKTINGIVGIIARGRPAVKPHFDKNNFGF
jgi:hypothetical protein